MLFDHQTFYIMSFHIDNDCDDNVHQFIISEETTLTVFNDEMERKTNSRSICIAFTVDDVNVEFERLKELGVEIVDIPAIRPWG